MIVDTSAYVFSLIMVLLCCVIRDFLIPLLVWKNYLKDKSYSYRFWFCVITQAALQINLVLLLGFLNIINRYTIIVCNVLIYTLIAWNFSDKKIFIRCKKNSSMIWRAYKEERLSRFMIRGVRDLWKEVWKAFWYCPIWKYIRKNWLEVILLGVLVVYNIWFLTHNVMLYHSYQFSDVPVHQSWIYALEHGILFYNGIYPFGMHAMVYIIRIIFCINLREIMLYAGAYQTVLLMIALYLLAKEIFRAKYTPVAAVIIVSLMLNQGRYAASLPQEAGMYAVVGLAYFMIRYLHADRRRFNINSDSIIRRFFRCNAYINRRYINSEMILLMLCVALVIAYHFYTAITAIFLVLAIGLAYIPKIFKKQYFIPLLFCGIMGAVIAVLPMGACLAKGIPFQEATAWATSVIAGEKWHGKEADYYDQLAAAQGREAMDDGYADNNTVSEEDSENSGVDYSLMTMEEILKYYYDSIFNFGALAMFGREATQLMFECMLIGFFCALMMLLRKKTRVYGNDYIALIIYMTILCTVGAAQPLGLIELIAAARASTFAEPFIGIIYLLPVDFAFRVLGIWKNRFYNRFLKMLSAAVCGIVIILILEMGWYHNFFDVNLAYYNESEYLLRNIKKSFKNNTYTIVSPTEEYYDVLDYGYHTQLSVFVDMVNGNQEAFTFPTEYVFFFIEKHIMQDYFYGPVDVDIKYALQDFKYLADTQDYYFQRAVIESQAYFWAKKFKEMYPRNFKVYYEDDIYIAYLMEQNTYSPYDLQIDYLADYKMSKEDAKNE